MYPLQKENNETSYHISAPCLHNIRIAKVQSSKIQISFLDI